MLTERFAAVFGGGGPVAAVRAPGRVNLIGEHTDYNGYPVLPMAIDRSIHAVFRGRSDRHVRVANASDRFPSRAFRVDEAAVEFPRGDWGSYVRAAVRGVLEEYQPPAPRGFDALFAGDIPIAAGLSSSSALVVAAALVFLHV
ncbi:MAG: galactokinase family protein, partial [Bacteroidota bacterium]|nr:galactokinase family protein [Bacteroidota bacterium]